MATRDNSIGPCLCFGIGVSKITHNMLEARNAQVKHTILGGRDSGSSLGAAFG